MPASTARGSGSVPPPSAKETVPLPLLARLNSGHSIVKVAVVMPLVSRVCEVAIALMVFTVPSPAIEIEVPV